MKIRRIDENNDWMFGRSEGSFYVSQQAIDQNIATKLKEWSGDCFFSQNSGVDYDTLLDKGQGDRLKSAVKDVILSCFGVVGVNSIDYIIDKRAVTISYDIDTIYSPNFQAEIGVPYAQSN